MCSALRKFIVFLRGRWLAPVLALAYVMAMIGLPWPTFSAVRGAAPFPCQGHQCGCHSAEECWGHCCCFTPAQRLAWAAANQVEPPAELIAAVSNHDEDEHLAGDDHPTAHPCRCHKKAAKPVLSASDRPVKSKKTKGYGFHAFQCQGISTLWVTTGAVAPSIVPVAWTFDWNVVGTVSTLGFSLSAVTRLPAVPPPRVLVAPSPVGNRLIGRPSTRRETVERNGSIPLRSMWNFLIALPVPVSGEPAVGKAPPPAWQLFKGCWPDCRLTHVRAYAAF